MTEFVVIFIVPANLVAPLTNTFSALIFSKHISGLFVCTLCILLPFPVLWQQRRVRYPFSRQAVLHGFFQDLNFHRLLTQKARDFPNLFQCFCELRSRNNVLPSSNDSNYCFFHLNSRMDWMPCKRATRETFMPGFIVCRIMAIFSREFLRLRASCPNRLPIISNWR